MAERDKIDAESYPDNATPPRLESGSLYQLSYFSRSRLDPFSSGREAEIRNILNVARSRNRKCAITGALTFNDDHFAQVLEGPRQSVSDVFSSILRDARHTRLVVLEEGWIERRDFADWTMAFVGDRDEPSTLASNRDLRRILARDSRSGVQLVNMMKYCLMG